MHSLSSLNAVTRSDNPFRFEYVLPSDMRKREDVPEEEKIYLLVVGAQSETASKASNAIINAGRQKRAARATLKKVGSGAKSDVVEFDPIEDDVERGQRMAASRLVGWEGISEPWSLENAHKLCTINQDIAAKVILYSEELANFI